MGVPKDRPEIVALKRWDSRVWRSVLMNALGLKAVAALRVFLGAAFLYAGLEKLVASAPFSAAGFLTNGTAGTLPDSVKGRSSTPRTMCGSPSARTPDSSMWSTSPLSRAKWRSARS